jgi:hypothetical protein
MHYARIGARRAGRRIPGASAFAPTLRIPMISRLYSEGARFARVLQTHRLGVVAGVRRFVPLYRHRRFSPDEIHFLDLLRHAPGDEALSRVVSKEELLAVQRRLNPAALHALTEDKVTFHRHCVASGLPVPAIHAIYRGPGAGSLQPPIAPQLEQPAQIDALLARVAADSLIVKPIDGVHGEGVMRLARDARGAWRVHDGGAADAASLVARFAASGYRGWLFQQRVRGHAELAALSATEALQTARMVTFHTPGEAPRLLAARLRLVAGDGAHDNFDLGRTGNLVANVDLGSGRIRDVVGRDPQRGCMTWVHTHPRTGRALPGFALPDWSRATALATQAALAFAPLRTIGWDVALTPDGPLLIEGNVTWDTLIGEPRMGAIYRELEHAARLDEAARGAGDGTPRGGVTA